MAKVVFMTVLKFTIIFAQERIAEKQTDVETVYSGNILYQYTPPTVPFHEYGNPSIQEQLHGNNGHISPHLAPHHKVDFQNVIDGNPLFAALLLSATLGLTPKSPGLNHPEHLPPNPYVALLLSQYGRYVPVCGKAHGLYSYSAANNYHNNKPFGSYKIYEETDG